tara:strand:+ start:377 stop:751 length:375 start_codon:yes stop_codon:yes gene_type:complete
MDKIFFNLYKDLHSSSFINTNPLKTFLFNTKQHVLILFYIASQPEKKSTLEEICYNISGKIISRSTIQNILKEGVLINFLKKEINEKDKREKYYKITEPATKVLENWAVEQNNVFSAVNNLKLK